jgi:hypothetical protein
MVDLQSVRAKGLALEGTVAALRPAYARTPEIIPEALQHYLQEDIVPDRWYPLDDYLSLLKILASTLDPAKAKGDLFRAFGIIAAQRDVRGVQNNVPEAMRPTNVGAFTGALAGVTGLATLVRRALHLRERYYSRGYYKVKRVAERRLMITLHDFPACAELCAVSTGYLTEVLRSAQVGAWVERASCRGNGDQDCRWEVRFGAETDVRDLDIFR